MKVATLLQLSKLGSRPGVMHAGRKTADAPLLIQARSCVLRGPRGRGAICDGGTDDCALFRRMLLHKRWHALR